MHSSSNRRFYPSICLEGRAKIWKTPQNIWCPTHDSIPARRECNTEVLLNESTCSVLGS